MKLNVQGLARSSATHPWRTIIVWIIVFMAAGVATKTLLAGSLSNSFDFTNSPESKQADQLIKSRILGTQPDQEYVIVSSAKYTAQAPEFGAYAGKLAAALNGLGANTVTCVLNPLAADPSQMMTGSNCVTPKPAGGATQSSASASTPPASASQSSGPQLVSKDGHHVILVTTIAGDPINAVDKAPKIQDVIHGSAADPNFQVLVFGNATAFHDDKTLSEEDLKKGEGFGLIIAFVVLIVVFAAVVAALLPVMMGIFAISVATGLLALMGIWFDFSFFTPNMISMMGLAVGIDYSLFIVSRFREERRHGLDKQDALAITGGTANRAVFFSGMTVVLALLGMMIVPTTIFRGLATGAILVVSVSVAASLTLLPALLSLLGDKINWPRLSKRAKVDQGELQGGFWDKITRGVMGHPVISLVGAISILVVLAIPYFSINTGMSGVNTLPNELETKQAFILMTKYFSGGESQPTQIAFAGDPTSPAVQQAAAKLKAALAQDPRFGEVGAIQPGKYGDAGVIDVTFTGDPQSPQAVDAIPDLRTKYIPQAFAGTGVKPLVGGMTAMLYDFFHTTDTYTPWIFAFVLGMSFILLTIVFRSIVVPAKAILMNLLSVGAAYGLVVAVFQKGWFNGAFHAIGFNYIRVPAVEAWLPLFMFSILFGLSMDYHVFLLSRIREEYDHTGNNGESVAFGLRTTGSIITGAALIMVAVFASFSHGRIVALQEMGFGLAVAVFLDATVVRSVLVPSAMKLLGDRNWYLPRWLRWIPKVEIEGKSGRHMNGGNGNGGEDPGEPDLVAARVDGD